MRELLYADDSALVATNPGDMQEIVDRFPAAATLFGLKINTTINTNCEHKAAITMNGNALMCSDNFTYLGSAVTSINSSDLEIEKRT